MAGEPKGVDRRRCLHSAKSCAAAPVAYDPRGHTRGDPGGRLGGERELARSLDGTTRYSETSTRSRATDGRTRPAEKAKTQMTRSGGAVFGSLLGGVIASVLGRR